MELAGWITGGALLGSGLYIIALSYARLVHNVRRRRNRQRGHSSPMPFIGPVLVVAGCRLLPIPFTAWTLLAFALDPDTVITMVAIGVALMRWGREP